MNNILSQQRNIFHHTVQRIYLEVKAVILLIYRYLLNVFRALFFAPIIVTHRLRKLLRKKPYIDRQPLLAWRVVFWLSPPNPAAGRRMKAGQNLHFARGEDYFDVKTVLAFMANLKNRVTDTMARKANRTTISLTNTEVEALEKLKVHFDTPSVSETIRRSISQSSVLKRYSDEEGDLVVERDGRRYVIPSRP